MDYYHITELEKTGFVTAICTSEGRGCWLSNCEVGWENYREVASHFGLNDTDLTATFQRHTSIVKAVSRKDAGKNVFYRPDPVEPADGIVTDEPGLMLCSMESDCTPVFLLDPVRKAIGMVHSGWKGTSSLISVHAIELMKETYGSCFSDILVAFGPCICRNCYEVGEDLIPPFSEHYSLEERKMFFRPKENGKYFLDINEAIRISLVRIGVNPENIFEQGDCTYHQKLFYSHRRQIVNGLPGNDNMFTGIMLKNES